MLVLLAGRGGVRGGALDADGRHLAAVRHRIRAVDPLPAHLLHHAQRPQLQGRQQVRQGLMK